MPPSPLQKQHWFVAIGASGSDGFLSIRHLLRELPPLSNTTVLIVLHRDTSQPSHLAEILAQQASMPVSVAINLEQFKRGCCYVGEPANHLTIAAQGYIRLVPDQFTNQHRNRTVDLLFSSVARYAQAKAIGVILRGALDDGSRGLAVIHHAGGLTMVLRPTADHECGMPGSAIAYNGQIDLTGDVAEIAASIFRIVSSPDELRAVAGSRRS